jgi:RNA polymerase sigma-70 factor (ECF subfamily)
LKTERESFDSDYVRRLTEGDPETERHFTHFFGDLLRIKLRARLRSREAIEDVRQETFVRVFDTLRRKGGVEHPERLGAFVNAVANNVMLELFRAEGRTTAMPEEGFEPVAAGVDIDSTLMDEERKTHVRRLLNQLPAKDRDLLRLVFLEERNKDDVCRQLNVDRDYLRVLLHRATTRLRESYRRATAALCFLYA